MAGVANAVTITRATMAHAVAVVQQWVPYHTYSLLIDPSWNYRWFLWELIIKEPSFTSFAAIAGPKLEGLIATERVRGAPLLKVRFLATAPWNYGPGKKRAGIGSGLLAHAVQLSKADGFNGCELSATPEAETFYERMGWDRTGQRDHEGLPIFQLPGAKVDGFLAKHPPFPTS